MASKTNTEKSRVLNELLETAHALRSHDVLTVQDLAKMQVICESPPEYTPDKVMAIRVKKAKVSQAAFASILNVSVSAVQKWESPASGKHPGGAAAKLLQLIEKKGLEAVLA